MSTLKIPLYSLKLRTSRILSVANSLFSTEKAKVKEGKLAREVHMTESDNLYNVLASRKDQVEHEEHLVR